MRSDTNMSNLSYTNKDFNSIYTELLEYAKKLSYRWDPSASDESDPGVVLLKLAAIIGDKDNYNIDKNILELMPASVQQLAAARQIFEQCGYYMHHYQSGKGILELTLKRNLGSYSEDKELHNYIVPMFTMFTDIEKSTVFTSIEDVTLNPKSSSQVPVIEGVSTKYTINNDPLITIQNIDHNNRLYFTEDNVAENGIFITNVYSTNSTKTNYGDWKKVNNLLLEPKNTLCYKFGVSIDNSVCYIEFPDDIENLIGEGLNITYVRSSGLQGNISANKIVDFYTDTYLLKKDVGKLPESLQATTEDVTIKNLMPITNGYDPETIDQAYRSYKRVKNTFETLVSLKDYTDYMITSGIASNGYVCDRTNDIQFAYRIKESKNSSNYIHRIVESEETPYYKKAEDGTYIQQKAPQMSATDLTVYGLTNEHNIQDSLSFKSSFTLNYNAIDDTKKLVNGDELENSIKSIQHDFKDYERNRILMLKNKYSIKANIVPKYTLSDNEKNQLLNNVEKSLYRALNSKEVEFGEAIDPQIIQDAIFSADERIKALIDFISPTYETYAVYPVYKNINGKEVFVEFREIRIDSDSYDGKYVEQKGLTRKEFNFLKESNKKLYYEDLKKKSFKEVKWEEDLYDTSLTYFLVDESLHDLWLNFRLEIFAKNILCGATPLYNRDTSHVFGVNQKDVAEHEAIVSVTTNTKIPFSIQSTTKSTESSPSTAVCQSSILGENENLLLTAPNFVEESSYSTWVKFIYSLSDNVVPDQNYSLTQDDFIIFFYKESDSDTDYKYVKYDSSDKSPAKFIKPVGITLRKGFNVASSAADWIYRNTYSGSGKTDNNSIVSDLGSKSFTKFIESLNSSTTPAQVLTGTSRIITQNVNEILINNQDNGCRNVYWFLNSTNKEGKYELFSSPEDTTYILKSGEYFVYTNDQKTSIHLLGEGTKLYRNKAWSTNNSQHVWSVDSVSYDSFISEGTSVLEGKWKIIEKIPSMSSEEADKVDEEAESQTDPKVVITRYLGLWATEQQQIMIGPGNVVTLSFSDNKIGQNDDVYVDNKGIHHNTNLINKFELKYKKEDGEYTTIVSDDETFTRWSIVSVLNLNMSENKPQMLSKNQQIHYKVEGQEGQENQDFTIRPEEDQSDDTYYVLANYTTSLLGGEDIDVKTIQSNYNPINMISYKVSPFRDSEKSVTQYSGYHVSASITGTEKSSNLYKYSYELPIFTLLPGKYLLQVETSDSTDDFELKFNNSKIEELFKSSHNDLKHLYSIVVLEKEELDCTITCTSEKENITLFLSPMYKYNSSNLKSFDYYSDNETFEQKLCEKLEQLDPTQLYNYLSNVTDNIVNPLDSSSFLNNKHFYNSFTICEWDTIVTDTTMTVHDVTR